MVSIQKTELGGRDGGGSGATQQAVQQNTGLSGEIRTTTSDHSTGYIMSLTVLRFRIFELGDISGFFAVVTLLCILLCSSRLSAVILSSTWPPSAPFDRRMFTDF